MAKLVTLHDANGEVIYPQTISDMDYSTSEQDTGCKWVDGKPIYKKTIDIGALPNATTKNIAHGISALGIMLDMRGVAFYTNGISLPLPFVAISQASISTNATSTDVVITTANDRTAASGYITLWYTKTTD